MNRRKINPQKILFFDTETTGFKPGNISQLSYIIVDGDNIRSNIFSLKFLMLK